MPDKPQSQKWYGYRVDLPDFRDLVTVPVSVANQPANFTVRGGFPLAPWDQGQLGSCTAHGVAGIITFDQMKQGQFVTMISRLFQYYNSRLLEGTQTSDSGATIRDAIKAYNQYGACPEKDKPYKISTFARKPSKRSYTDAMKHRPLKYMRVDQQLTSMKAALLQGYPIIIGFSVYESFESNAVAADGIVPMPATSEQLMGGHCVIVDGYDDASSRFGCRNSWGTNWGQGGYFTIPYDYLLNPDLAEDFWIVETIG